MASEKPVLHGRDHLPGGPDPIRNLIASGLPFAYLEGGGTLPAGPTADDYWWDMLPQSTDFTNATDVYANASETIAAGPGTVNSGVFHGLSFLKNGMFVAFKTLQIASLESDATVRGLSAYQDGVGGPDISSRSDMIFGGNANTMILGNGSNMEIWSIDNAPTNAILLRTENAEASSYVCTVGLLVVQISPISFALL